MNNNMKIANAIVGVLLVVCLVVLCLLSSERRQLLEELQGLRNTPETLFWVTVRSMT